MRIQIGDRSYSTKKAALEAVRSVLYRYEPGDTLNEIDGEFVLSLLDRHPRSEIKRGCGVVSVQVEGNAYGTVGFWVTRRDGTRTDFGIGHCLKPPTHRARVLAALREEVRYQIREFLAQDNSTHCALSGAKLLCVHVDHEPPFRDLVASFLGDCELDFSDIEVPFQGDGDTTSALLGDRDLAIAWHWYHGKYATLRATTPEANLTRPRT